MAPKLTKNSAAVKLLLSKFRNGIITDTRTPAEVWKSESPFQQYKLPTFRTRFHKVKKEVSAEKNADESGEQEDELNRRCTGIIEGSKKRRLIDDSAEEDDMDEASVAPSVDGIELTSDIHVFKPLYLLSMWEEEVTRTRRISVAIALPSGIGPGEFSVRVGETGTFVELTVRWPEVLVNMKLLHKKWLISEDPNDKIESYHPRISGFEKYLMQHRHLVTDAVESMPRINLPYAVETHIAGKYNLGWMDSTVRVVYLELKGAIQNYAVGKDCDDFKLV